MKRFQAADMSYFYPRSPCGERPSNFERAKPTKHFYPRSPCGERLTDGSICFDSRELFLSTLSLRRATSYKLRIHQKQENFYPRSPCGERHDLEPSSTRKLTFLSTLSLRRATFSLLCRILFRRYFYPRSPCGERQLVRMLNSPHSQISIHALLAESDNILDPS